MSANIAVVGGGILGLTTALLSARAGHMVKLFERRGELFAGASASNEGKVHLGLVYALAGHETHDLMLRGAMRFAPVIENALASPVDWRALATAEFTYLAMPQSLMAVHDLAAVYLAINARFREQYGTTARYLGEPLRTLSDERPHVDIDTGMPAFRTAERAIDPRRLGELLIAAVRAHPSITVATGRRVTAVRADGDRAIVHCENDGSADAFDGVVNCAWEGQQELLPPQRRAVLNYRVKTAVRIPVASDDSFDRVVTLVIGPFGDVVRHADHVYASWYPDARISNSQGSLASAEAHAALDNLTEKSTLAQRQLASLESRGLIPSRLADGELVGGFILARGAEDIDVVSSGLHQRHGMSVDVDGRVLTPRNFKLSTAPLCAERTVGQLERLLA